MKANIVQLKNDITEAKSRQEQANKDIKKIEKDMKDFDKNKDNKLAELQVSNHLGFKRIGNGLIVLLGFCGDIEGTSWQEN